MMNGKKIEAYWWTFLCVWLFLICLVLLSWRNTFIPFNTDTSNEEAGWWTELTNTCKGQLRILSHRALSLCIFLSRATRCGGDIVTLLWFRQSVVPSVRGPCEHHKDYTVAYFFLCIVSRFVLRICSWWYKSYHFVSLLVYVLSIVPDN